MTANKLRSTIMNDLRCEAVIVSPSFTGKNRVQQHQLVYLAPGERMHAKIHALAMRTFTPEAWAQSTTQ